MRERTIKPDIYAVGAIDWDRRLFDELIPLPDGTTYNSYLIKGSQKTALIDTVDPAKEETLKRNLEELNIKQIDYVISQHAEQDHSGSLPRVLEWFPKAKVVTNEKCKTFLMDLLPLKDDQFIVIADKEKLSLGNKTLEFYLTPWVHWPETMVTYLREDKVLFSCDFFGAHITKSHLFVQDEAEGLRSAKRYFAEIMMPFRVVIRNNIKIIEGLAPDIIAPSHGLVYPNPKLIIDAYKDWTSDEVKNEVVIPYVSMHGSTQKMVDHFIGALMDRGIEAKPFNLSRTDIGELAMALVDAATLVIGTPTVLAGPHPLAANAAILANALRPKTRFISLIGSFGWGGKMVEMMMGLIPNIKAEEIEPVIIKGDPKENDFKLIDELAIKIDQKHKSIAILK